MILVTGAEGFIGHHLCRKLRSENRHFVGTYYERNSRFDPEYVYLDLRDGVLVGKILARYRPLVIVNLGSQSFPEVSWKMPKFTYEANLFGTINLIEAVFSLGLGTRIFFASTSGQYGGGGVTKNKSWLTKTRSNVPFILTGSANRRPNPMPFCWDGNWGSTSFSEEYSIPAGSGRLVQPNQAVLPLRRTGDFGGQPRFKKSLPARR